jgi:hypothetical protein
MTRSGNDHRFDAAMRDLHAQSLSQVSAATTAQLHRRRHAALQGEARPRRRFGWPAAAAFASLLVVALGRGGGRGAGGAAPAPPPPARPPPARRGGLKAVGCLDDT